MHDLRVVAAGDAGDRLRELQHCGGTTVVLLLAGGDKSSQARDIATAKRVAAEWKD